jgi:hypothetical protein
MGRLLVLPVTALLAACTITEGFEPPTAQSTYKADVVEMAKDVCAPQGKIAVFYSKTGATGSVPFDNPSEAGFDCEPRRPAVVTNSVGASKTEILPPVAPLGASPPGFAVSGSTIAQ